MSLLVLHQVAGKAVVPQELQQTGWAIDPEDTAKVLYILNAFSIGQHVLGDMSTKLDYAILMYPMLSAMAPDLDKIVDILGDMGRSWDNLVKINDDALHHPERFEGDPRVKYNYEANKAVTETLDNLSAIVFAVKQAAPNAGVVLHALANFNHHLPGILSNTFRQSIRNPALANHEHPIKAAKSRSYPGANISSALKALRFAIPYRETVYELSIQGQKAKDKKHSPLKPVTDAMVNTTQDFFNLFPGNHLTPDRNDSLNSMQRESGIPGG
jgi:hypothetical protein